MSKQLVKKADFGKGFKMINDANFDLKEMNFDVAIKNYKMREELARDAV